MRIVYLKKFIKQYKKLPVEIKKIAKEKELLFREDPRNISLKTHKLHGDLKSFWAFSVNNKIRIIFDFDQDKNVRFYTIGNHDVY